MRKRLLALSAAVLCMAATTVSAQAPQKGNRAQKAEQEITRATNKAQLQTLSNSFGLQYGNNKQKALQLAKEKGWVVRQVSKTGQVMSLEGVDALGFPIYYITDHNTRAAASIKTDQLWAGGSTGLNLSGSNPALSGKLGVWDGGLIRATHQELTGRMVNRDGATAISDHATHVAGTMVASGVNALAKGMSFGAPNLQGWDFSNDIAEMTAAASGLLVSNHSYGTVTGWFYNDARAGTDANPFWEWRGNATVSTTEDVNFGYYNSQAQSWDIIAYNAPYYLMVKSAGNNRSVNGPAVGAPCWFPNASNVLTVIPRPANVSSNNGYDIVSTYGTAKNILTVGAVEPIPNGWQRKEDVRISSFSSYGPTDDGRIKPDVVGNGVSLISSVGTGDSNYSSMNGTSMSAPNVSGSLNLLQEQYYNKYGVFMRAATLKGLAIHTADEAGNTGPDYIYGWGLVNMERAANHIINDNSANMLQERTLEQGQTYTFNVTASGKGPLVVTISWTDPEGAVIPLGTSALNNRSPRLINDLDIRVNRGMTVFMPWVLDPNNPANPAGFGDNIRDNVEQVFIANAVPGETYTITVSHKGTLTRGPQAYSLLVSGIGGSQYCASGAISDADSKITNLTFGGINNSPAGCANYSNFTSMIATAQIGQTLPLSLSLGTCGADNNKIAKVFIDWNGNGTFESNELVATTPMMASTGTFNTNVAIPQSVTVNTQVLMRVVLVETDNADDVQACGNYAKGETQDYLVQFVGPTKDVGISSLLFPTQDLCANPSQTVSVMLRNYASEAQTNLPITVTVTSNGSTVATLNTTYTSTLAPFSEVRIIMPGTFAVEAGRTYQITSQVTLADDQVMSNNQRTDVRTASAAPAAPQATATSCGTTPVSLKGTGNGTIYWYDAATGGNLVAVGNSVLTSTVPAGNTYFAALNDFSGKIGPTTKEAFTGGGYGQFSPSVLVTAHAPFVLESAKLYIGNPGRITFAVETLAGATVSSTTLEVAATRNPAATGSQPDDPTDQGAVYPLNLTFPSAGNYRITISYENGATIYRNNAGVTGYPFTIPNVMSITGNTASGTPLNFYYYFYDMNVKALGCASPRVAVPIAQGSEAVATITPASATTFCVGGSVVLQANTGQGLTYAWFRDGVAIANATSANFTATLSGNYTVSVTEETGCSKLSAAVTVTANPVPPTSITISRDVNLNMCLGENFTQTLRAVTSTTHASFTYQWFRDGAAIPNATSSTFAATSNGSYTVTLSASCGSGITSAPTVINNDAAQVTAQPASICTGTSASLSAQTTSGKLYWFSAATGGNLLRVGTTYTTPTLTQNTTYHVVASDETGGRMGSLNHSAGGSVSSFTGGRMYVNASVPFVLDKATINVATAGTMTIIITDKDLSNTVIQTVTINVTPGIREYDLGLIFPAAGNNYGIQVSAFGGGATAYRNNSANSAVYPYTLAGIGSITGNNQTTPSSFYYFLYDWQVSTLSCQTAPRVAVPVTITPTTVAGTLTASASEVCAGDNGTVTLSGQTGSVIRWESSLDGTNWTTIANTSTSLAFENITATTRYRAVVQSGSCASATTPSVTVTVSPTTVAGNLTASTSSVCHGTNQGTITLADHVGAVVRWESSTNGATWATINNTTTTHTFTNLTKATMFRAVVKSGACSEAITDIVIVSVTQPTVAGTLTASVSEVCTGTNAGTLTLSGKTGDIVHWEESLDGTTWAVIANSASTLEFRNLTATKKYRVLVKNGVCSSAYTPEATITVNQLPLATISPSGSTTFCQGETVTLTAPAGTGYAYLWSTGATTRSIVVGASGNYTVTVTSPSQCSATSEATKVTVNELPSATITASGPLTFCQGGKVTLTAPEGQGYTYLWSNGATTRAIEVTQAGSYSVTVTTSGNCSVMSAATTVTVTALPTAAITASGSTTLCQGQKVTLTATAGTGYTYLWSNGTTTQSIETGTAGEYTVRVTNASNCTVTSEAVTVTVNALPVAAITASGATTFCEGGNVTLTASEGSSYLWSNGAITRSITVSASGNYTVTVTNQNQCTATSQAVAVAVNALPAKPTISHSGNVLTSSATSGNQWFLNGVAISGANAQTLNATQSGIYTVQVINTNMCESTMSESINVTLTSIAKASTTVSSLQVYPNPSAGTFTVSFTTAKPEKVRVVLINSIGQTLYENTQNKVAGTHEQLISMDRLPTGVYTLQVHSSGKVMHKKVVVRH